MMNDFITQTRLALRLDGYLGAYQEKRVGKDHLYGKKWDVAWRAAEVARTNNTLTPELVDDVRLALNTF